VDSVSYKKEYDKVIPKAETHKEIKQPPNIGIRKRRAQNKTPKQKEPVRQTPDDLDDEFVMTRRPELQNEYDLYEDQKKKRKDNDGGPHEKYILKIRLYVFYDPDNTKHTKLKTKWGEEHIIPHADGSGGLLTRIKYVKQS
jgi:hypothetical protein